MKIGVLTHHYVTNYGAFLQTYCLREAIAELFPDADVYIIDFINLKHSIINRGGFFRYYPKNETFKSWLDKNRLPRIFSNARKTHMKLTKRVYSTKALNALNLDTIVIGSDEVWNYLDSKSYLPVKFGVGIKNAKLLTYAASAGGVTSYKTCPKEIKDGLKNFSALSVRDNNTNAFLQHILGKQATRVLDPVFLHSIPSASSKRIEQLTKQPYILFYHFAALNTKTKAEISTYAKQHGLLLLGAGEYNSMYDLLSQSLTPFEWAELFKKASIVFTGTFHGVVFSVVNQRPFYVCPNNPTRAEKISSLLDELDLSQQLISAEQFQIKKMMQTSFSYDNTEIRLKTLRNNSLQFLKNAILCQHQGD